MEEFSTDQNVMVKEGFFFRWQKHKLFIVVIGSIIVLLIVIITAFLLLQKSKTIPSFNNNSTSVSIGQQPQDLSDIHFDVYKNNASLPTVPISVNVYALKNNFTFAEISALAIKLGIQNVTQPVGNNNVNYTAVDRATKSLLSFDSHTGAFSYQSKGYLRLQSGQQIISQVESLLGQIGFTDGTITCPITYQRQSFPAVTFIECHRNWVKTGLPIYNFQGLLNTPQTTTLSALQLGKVAANIFPDDSDITNVTGVVGYSPNGKARPNEFNTATVAVMSDGTIASIVSNLRFVTNTEILSSATNLLTPQQALQQFINHKAPLSLTEPLGSGNLNMQKVYQDNKAIAKEAVITDYVLSYLEKLPSETQQYLVPMYTIRGQATLITGYRVSFVQTIPALQDGRTFLSQAILTSTKQNFLTKFFTFIKNFLQPNTYAETQTLQLGTFNPFASPSPSSGIPPHPTTPSTGTLTKCFDYSSLTFADTSKSRNFQHGITKLSESTFTIPGSGTIKFANNLAVALGAAGGWASDDVFYELSSFPVSGISQAADIFYGLVTNQYAINVARHLVTDQSGALNASSIASDVKNVFAAINGGQCPVSIPPANSAPEYNCSASGAGGMHGSLDTTRQNNVADATAKQILDAIKSNTIDSLANQQDIYSGGLGRIFVVSDTSSWSNNPILAPLGHCYISGGVTLVEGASPSLFIYSQKKQKVSITLPLFTTYTDPATNVENSWNVIAFPDRTLQEDNNKTTYQNLYYEYAKEKVTFSKPKDGFVIPFNQWENTVRNIIAVKLELTQQETDRLVGEVRNALYGEIKSPYLILSLVSQDEIDKKLPLKISPQTDNLYRIEILVTPANKNVSLPTPVLTTLKRTEFMAVELGARVE